MKILVIDDKKRNLEAAKLALPKVNFLSKKIIKVDTVSSFVQACRMLEADKYDIVMTDLMMPMENTSAGSLRGENKSQSWHTDSPVEVPYGFLIHAKAKQLGVEKVIITTAIDHHSDWLGSGIADFLDSIHPYESSYTEEVDDLFQKLGLARRYYGGMIFRCGDMIISKSSFKYDELYEYSSYVETLTVLCHPSSPYNVEKLNMIKR